MKSKVNEIIKSDLFRYYGVADKKTFKKVYSKLPGFKYTYFLRKAAYFKRSSFLGIYYRFRLKKCSDKYGFQIPIKAKIGEGLYIGHFGTIIIHNKVKIGKFCNIAPGTVIGQTNRGELKGTPIIGNKVWIGGNSIIIGNIKIGNNVLIAPGSYINFDVPDDSIVIGNPGKIIPKKDATKGYVCNILE